MTLDEYNSATDIVNAINDCTNISSAIDLDSTTYTKLKVTLVDSESNNTEFSLTDDTLGSLTTLLEYIQSLLSTRQATLEEELGEI